MKQLLIFLFFINYITAQKTINGITNLKLSFNDTLIINSGGLENKYYLKNNFNLLLKKNRVDFKNEFSYPQLHFVALSSERGKIPNKGGCYFFDKETTAFFIDSLPLKSYTNGKTHQEYESIFCPFILKNSNHKSVFMFIYKDKDGFDKSLKDYIINHKNSFVGLWFLIKQLSQSGYSTTKEKALNSFSSKVKEHYLWRTLKADFDLIQIKVGKPFPKLMLQNENLEKETLTFKKAKYTLVDFWFSRCKPCLEQMPEIRKLHDKFNTKGFEVIGISNDKTINVKKYWQPRIKEYQLIWKNYLDENGAFTSQEKINVFPTNFLLDSNLNVIKKDISMQELENLLEKELVP